MTRASQPDERHLEQLASSRKLLRAETCALALHRWPSASHPPAWLAALEELVRMVKTGYLLRFIGNETT